MIGGEYGEKTGNRVGQVLFRYYPDDASIPPPLQAAVDVLCLSLSVLRLAFDIPVILFFPLFTYYRKPAFVSTDWQAALRLPLHVKYRLLSTRAQRTHLSAKNHRNLRQLVVISLM